jgi:hypothetical protein
VRSNVVNLAIPELNVALCPVNRGLILGMLSGREIGNRNREVDTGIVSRICRTLRDTVGSRTLASDDDCSARISLHSRPQAPTFRFSPRPSRHSANSPRHPIILPERRHDGLTEQVPRQRRSR